MRERLPDLGIVLALAVGISLIAQRWSGLDTPDSSFYASLSLYGDQITDRAPFTSYFWTRLGFIGPVQVLTTILGPWLGFAAWRLALIAVMVASNYFLLRRFTHRAAATWLTAIISLSTVPLSYFGNTYLTGAVLAGTSALIYFAVSGSRGALVLSGLTLGWLTMVNPPGVLLAGTVWLSILIYRHVSGNCIRALLPAVLIAAVSTVVTFLLFLVWGRIIFPKMNWFSAYLDARQITLSNFSSGESVYLEDISLVVVALVFVVVVALWIFRRQSTANQLALLICSSSIAFMLVFNPLMGGIALEAPMYQSMLWPPSLIALALSLSAYLPPTVKYSTTKVITAVLAIALVLVAGFAAPTLSLVAGWIIGLIMTTVLIFSVLSQRNQILIIAGIAIFLAGAQLLQNSRDDLGLYYLSPYSWAFASNPISEKIHTAVNSQEWLLANTSSSDQIMLWVDGPWVQGDRELYVAAGMQLWGENRITLEPTLTEVDVTRLNEFRPTTLALFGKSMDAIYQFWSSIPAANNASTPRCYDYAWPADSTSDFPTYQGHTCLTSLNWN